MANKSTITARLRKVDGLLCAYCRRTMDIRDMHLMPTRDHVHPRSKGGRETVWACWLCNHMKADMTMENWQAFMIAAPGWWKSVRRTVRKQFALGNTGQLAVIPLAETKMILEHGKKYWRAWKANENAACIK